MGGKYTIRYKTNVRHLNGDNIALQQTSYTFKVSFPPFFKIPNHTQTRRPCQKCPRETLRCQYLSVERRIRLQIRRCGSAFNIVSHQVDGCFAQVGLMTSKAEVHVSSAVLVQIVHR